MLSNFILEVHAHSVIAMFLWLFALDFCAKVMTSHWIFHLLSSLEISLWNTKFISWWWWACSLQTTYKNTWRKSESIQPKLYEKNIFSNKIQTRTFTYSSATKIISVLIKYFLTLPVGLRILCIPSRIVRTLKKGCLGYDTKLHLMGKLFTQSGSIF